MSNASLARGDRGMGAWAGMNVRDGLDLSGLDPTDLWWRYAALGGSLTLSGLMRAVHGEDDCFDPIEHDITAVAINEAFVDLGLPVYPVATVLAGPPVVEPLLARALRRRAAAAQRRSHELRRTSLRLQAQSNRLLEECRHGGLPQVG